MINIAGVVILYNPEPLVTIENIRTYIGGVKKLYIYDNSENLQPELKSLLEELDNKVSYYFFGINQGISKRLNEAANEAIKDGYDYLLTMDQDSSFTEGAFDQYLQLVNDNKSENIAQYGVNCDPAYFKITDKPSSMDSLITSGTIVDLIIFNTIGGFDENLFIDFVDVEYSLRCVDKGYVNLMFLNVIMNHEIGFRKLGRSFKNFKKTARILHSPIRVYYIVRNGLYMLFRVSHINKKARKSILVGHLKMLKNDFLYNDNLFQVYKNTVIGFFDFFRNKMGKR